MAGAPSADTQGPLALVFAHPDDETFAMGGTLARAAAAGVRTVLWCATPGDAGKSSGVVVSGPEELGRIRRRELDDAAAILGIASVTHGDFGDGRLAAADPDAAIGEIVAFLRRHRPATVATFGPEGAPTGHRDHKAISRLATAAYFLSGLETAFPDQLGGDVAPHRLRRLVYVAWAAPSPASADLQSVPPTLEVDTRATHDAELRAFLAHRSQRDQRVIFERECLTPTEPYALIHGDTDFSAPGVLW